MYSRRIDTEKTSFQSERNDEKRFCIAAKMSRRPTTRPTPWSILPASGWVALGRCRPRAPTDPDVLALEHPVPQPTDSPSVMVPAAIPSSDGDMWIKPRCARHGSLEGVCRPTFRFPPQGPPGRVPLLHQYYQDAMTSCRLSHRTSLPSFGGTSMFTR